MGKNLRTHLSLTLFSFAILLSTQTWAQDTAPVVSATVPHMVQYSGAITNSSGAAVNVKFALYAVQTGGEAVWTESQTVTTDAKGRYAVLLGFATPGGLPQQVFSNAEAKWLGITVGDGAEAPRTILVATPYSLKASDAETLGGHPVSDFKLATNNKGKPEAGVDITAVDAGTGIDVTGNGTATVTVSLDPTYLSNLAANYAPLHANNTFVGNQTITGSAAISGNLSVNGTITSPYLNAIAATLPTFAANNTFTGSNTFSKPIVSTVATGTAPFTVASTTAVPNLNASLLNGLASGAYAQVGAVNLFSANQVLTSNGTATASGGFDSASLKLTASSYNSSTAAAVPQNFFWKAERTGNDTASPSGTLNLLYSTGTAIGAETGFNFNSGGVITFAAGQTFPGTGTGNGTITGITTTSPLSGSGTTGSVALSLNTSALETTLNGVYPQLAAATNTFTGGGYFDSYVEASQTAGGGYAAVLGYGSSGSVGTFGDSDTGYGAQGQSTSGIGVYGTGGIVPAPVAGVFGVYGSGATGVYGTSATGIGTKGISSAADTNGVVGDETAAGGYGVYAHANGAQDTVRYQTVGVYGLAENGIGVLGVNTGVSNTFNSYKTGFTPSVTSGVWGDTSSDGADFQAAAIVGTADDNSAAFFVNNSANETTVFASNNSTGGSGIPSMAPVITAMGAGGICGMNSLGDVTCSGRLKTAVPVAGSDQKVEVYSVQSAENWFEDFGSAKLENGSVTVAIDPTFAGIVNTGVEYHIFLTPQGECEGLYIANKSANGFEVRELHHGASSVSFDYRIVAKRAGHESERLADATPELHTMTARRDMMEARRLPARGAKINPAENDGMPLTGTSPHETPRPAPRVQTKAHNTGGRTTALAMPSLEPAPRP